MTDTADLVKSLRADALWASQGMQIIAERHTSWQAAAALEATQARAEAAEKVADDLGEMARQFADELIAAEASLAAARDAALEEAAKIADGWLEQWVDVKIAHVPPHAYAADAIRDLRDGIRALKTAGKE